VAEQFPDRDRVVREPDRAQVIVGRAVQVEAAVGHQPEHGDRRDQHGDRVDREPVAGA
jgi:hypothetical protein